MPKPQSLYEIIGVPKTATLAEIARAYRVRSLQCHPDRNPNGAEAFKALAAAYEVLRDEERRAVYDETGRTGDGDDDTAPAVPSLDKEEMGKMMSDFYGTYRGSQEEIADICESYRKVKGDFVRLATEELIYENAKGEVERLRDVVRGLVDGGVLKATDAWARTSGEESLKKLKRRMKREREEAAEALAEMGAKKGPKGEGLSSDMASLQALILGRQREAADSFHASLDDMAKRYGGGSSGKKKGGASKRA